MVEGEVGRLSVSRNAMHAAAGFVLPTAVVLASYPVLVGRLGATAFGVYLLAASVSGTLTLLDPGFSAATLKFVAEDVAARRLDAAAAVIVTSTVFYTGLGIAAGALVATLAPRLVTVFRIDQRMALDAVRVFRLAGLQFAVLLPATVFVSIAKGLQQFDRSTIFVSLLAIANYGGAALAVLLGAELVGAVVGGLVASTIALAAIAMDGIRLCRAHGIHLACARPTAFRRLFGFGWVMAVNSLSGFLLYHVQKYLVSAAMGPAAVTVYQTAAIVPSKVHAAVNASTEVLFPFSSSSRDRAALRRVYLRMLGGSGVVALGGFAALTVLARPVLAWWIGAPLARSVSPLVPIFALAYVFLALSPAPFHLVNGLGRPGLNTIFYAANALVNLALLGVFALSGLTLEKFAWAFAVANILTCIAYQAAIEAVIWRAKPQLAEATL